MNFLLTILNIFNFTFAMQMDNSKSVNNKVKDYMYDKVEQGICQKEYVDSQKIRVLYQSDQQTIYAAVCSKWAFNTAWSLFLVVEGSDSTPLIQPLLFLRHSNYKGLYADSVVHNIKWFENSHTLTSRRYLNGYEHCGAIASYKWSNTLQTFITERIIKKDDCRDASAAWEEVSFN